MRDALSILQLYALAGEDALKTPYSLLIKFIYQSLQHKKQEAESTMYAILEFPVTDIVTGISSLLSSAYKSKDGDILYPIKQKAMISKLFKFFYNPVAQQAMKSEAGMTLLLQSFIEQTNGGQ